MRLADATVVAEDFARALVAGDFLGAYGKLSVSGKARYSPFGLRARYIAMCLPGRLFGNIFNDIQTIERMEDWPAKQQGDIAWVYVSIHGDRAGEAVTVVVASDATGLGVRKIEWGRP
jgi:hypothetical protein